MATSREQFALDWIKGELLETLNSARLALEAFVEADEADEADEASIRGCLEALHQVHGTLVMLELKGVALLADHMEQLAQRLVDGGAADVSAASQVLMQGILELPGYIDEIQSGEPDSVEAVTGLVNELRKELGETLLGPQAEAPAIARPAPESALSRFSSIDGAEKARKIRAAYQQVLLTLLKGQEVAGSVDMLAKVAQGLQRICQGTPHEQQWQAFGEFAASLRNHQGPLRGDAIKLLRRLDSEIRLLGTHGEACLKEPVSIELVAQLLDQAAARNHHTEVTASLRDAIRTEEPAHHTINPTGRQALSSAALALREELLLVKDQLDLTVRAGGQSTERLLALVAPLKQIASTLSLLGFDNSRRIVADQLDTLARLEAGAELEQSAVMAIARALVQVDENLASFSHEGKDEAERIVDEAAKTVTREARQGLEQVKQDVVDFIAAGWDPRHLGETPERIAVICGALSMIPLSRAAQLLGGCGRYVVERLAAGQRPEPDELERFADAVSGLDYYLERTGEDTVYGLDDVLDLVARSLAALDIDPSVPWTLPAARPEPEREQEALQVPEEAAVESAALELAAETLERRESAELADEEGLEEPALELDEDPDFDLSDASFDDLGGVERPAALAEEAESVAADLPEEFPPETEELPEALTARQPETEAPEPEPAALELDELELEALSAEEPEPVAKPEAPQPALVSSSTARPKPAPAVSLADTFETDPEIVEIFVEEVEEVLETIGGWLPTWREDLEHEEALTEVRRAFHTLKGSGRIVGANIIGELAWSVENMLNRLIDGTVAPTAEFAGVVERARTLVPELKDAFEAQQRPDMSRVGFVMEQADVLASGGSLAEAAEPEPAATVLEQPAAPEAPEVPAATAAEQDDSVLIFVGEAREHLAALEESTAADGTVLSDAAVRALHTLAGSAGMAEFSDIEQLARPTYELASALKALGREMATGEADDFFREAFAALEAAVTGLAEGRAPEEHSQLIAEADRLIVAADRAALDAAASSRSELMALPGLAEIMEADVVIDEWRATALAPARAERLLEGLTEVRNAALRQPAEPIAELAHAFAGAVIRLREGPLDQAAHTVLREGHEQLLRLFDTLAAGQSFAPVTAMIDRLDALDRVAEETEEDVGVLTLTGDVTEPGEEIRLDDLDDEDLLDEEEIAAAGDGGPDVRLAPSPTTVQAEEVAEVEVATTALPAAVAELLPDELDEEIIEVFFEEADEILEALEENIHRWSSEPENQLYLEHLLRGLHTLKGGARLSGLTRLGDATHQFESFLIDVQNDAGRQDDRFFDDVHARYDEITSLLTVIRKALAGESVTMAELAGEAGQVPAAPVAGEPPAEPPAERPAVAPAETEPLRPVEPAAPTAAEEPVMEVRPGQEMVRVGAGLLEELVNLAGESSIVRARVEQGMSDFTNALEEMETTIERLREQLRRLEIETEAQILFRQDLPEGQSYANFDPLEMDRYSQLQQLSRGLSESASDMLDLKETLLYKARESETLLLQQARINTELQEGLMRTRMVPFSRLLPRLRRIVRQVSAELGKEVELHAFNAEGELDRSLLERMVPPLEHMLRNAVDHGIESPELRKNYGKAATGRIDLRLSREGGDVVIEISDDGAGIDVESVRAKAIERGLMSEDAKLSDEEISQFVLAPGFSTAKSVTLISGRGVGMDVVHSEVKQLGGSVQIASRQGKGTRFIVRVPFTVSVNRALMVSVGDDYYAVPLNNIEGIVLLSTEELEKLYAPDGGSFEYAGVPYRVRYLGHYLGREFRASNQQSSVPVVLVRSGEQAVAVHVDGVQGSREIVVKSLGPQFAGVGGISGATILGDGSVVVILDLLALIRTQGSDGRVAARRPLAAGARTRCVMVVDDSVTVRKVTSRLLERQGMDVLVAKDGVEAVALLQERRPDVMLLDIEMPRMDGFEVARQVRHDERLNDLPIVMISSRTGTKHQEHAAELGVNRFLGKPFQENELLATIDSLVD